VVACEYKHDLESFLKTVLFIMLAQGFTLNSCFRIGLLPGSRRANVVEEDVMMSSYISEESEKELELDPPKLNPEDCKPW
jgi:hypothetical protein